jgi:hypothetical protein
VVGVDQGHHHAVEGVGVDVDKLKYDLEPLKFALNIIKEFNALDIQTLDFYNNGVKIDVPQEAIDSRKYVGLSNKEFAVNYLLKEFNNV